MDAGAWKDIAAAVESAVTALAIVIAGVWTYMLFIKGRDRYPRAAIKHDIGQAEVSPNKRLIHAAATIRNNGKVLVHLHRAATWVQQVTPLAQSLKDAIDQDQDPVKEGASEIEWPLIEERNWSWDRKQAEIEPGESETLVADFIVDADVRVVAVYTFVKNASKKGRELGWARTTLWDIEKGRMIQGEDDATAP